MNLFGTRFSEEQHVSLVETVAHRRWVLDAIVARDQAGVPTGGIVAESISAPEVGDLTIVHIGNPFIAEPSVFSFISPLRVEEVQKIKDSIFPTEEAYKILESLAMGHTLRSPVMLEGDPSVGKTFLIAKFTELLMGKGVSPVDFYCHRGSESSDLKGKWVPGSEHLDIDSSVQALLINSFNQHPDNMAELAFHAGVTAHKSEFAFEYGGLTKAMMYHREPDGKVSYIPGGEGIPLHIEEVGQATPGVINSLLEIRGDSGRLTDAIQLHEHHGEMIPAGPRFNLFMSTNFPDGHGMQQRSEIDSALANGLLWVRIPSLSMSSIRCCAAKFFQYADQREAATDRPFCAIDLKHHQELAQLVADVISIFHREFEQMMKAGEPGRAQPVTVTLRDMSLAAELINSNQVCDAKNSLDLPKTIIEVVEYIYIGKIKDSKIRDQARKQISTLLYQDATGQIQFQGNLMTRADAILQVSKTILKNDGLGVNRQAIDEYCLARSILQEKTADGRYAGGIYAEENKAFDGTSRNKVYICNPFKSTPLISIIDTPLSAEQVELIKAQIYPIKEAYEILEELAVSYMLKAPTLIEGDTSIGKTYIIKHFAALLTGSKKHVVDFYCSLQTEPGALLGTWVPGNVSKQAKIKWQEYVLSEFGQAQIGAIKDEVQELLEQHKVDIGMASQMFQERIKQIAMHTGIFKSEKPFDFQAGAIAQSMTAKPQQDGSLEFGEGGSGCLLHLQEIGCAHPSLLGVLLQMGGEKGKVAREIQIHEGLGESIKAGNRFFMVMSTNPAEGSGYRGRQPLDAALTSRVRYRYVEGLRTESVQIAAEYALKRKSDKDKPPVGQLFDFHEHPEIVSLITDIITPVHLAVAQAVEVHEKGLRQKVPVTMRTLETFCNFIDSVQSIGSSGDIVDLAATMRNGLGSIYIAPHRIPDVGATARKKFDDKLRETIQFEGQDKSREEVLQILTERAVKVSTNESLALETVNSMDKEAILNLQQLREQLKDLDKLPAIAARTVVEELLVILDQSAAAVDDNKQRLLAKMITEMRAEVLTYCQKYAITNISQHMLQQAAG